MSRTNVDSWLPTRISRNCQGHRVGCDEWTRGFTLVELLVVVSIIALLISILLPSLKSAREQAKTIKCLCHSRGLAQAGLAFSVDHRDRFQLSATEGDEVNGVIAADPDRTIFDYDTNDEILAWPVALAQTARIAYHHNWDWGARADGPADAWTGEKKSQMADDFELAICPADKVQIATPFYPQGADDGLKGVGDPINPYEGGPSTSYWGYLSFGINEDVVGSEARDLPACWKDGYVGEVDEDAGYRLRGRMERIFDPATVMLIVDAGANSRLEALESEDVYEPGEYSNYGLGNVNLIISARARGPELADSVWKWPQRIPTKRHPGGAVNVTFADFHAASVKPVGWRPHPSAKVDKVPAKYNRRVRVSPYKPG